MIQLVPQLKILVAYEPVDFRKGIDGLVAVCRQHLQQDPFSGCVFLFRNRAATAVKLLVYDGTGFWLCLKRFSQGRLRWLSLLWLLSVRSAAFPQLCRAEVQLPADQGERVVVEQCDG